MTPAAHGVAVTVHAGVATLRRDTSPGPGWAATLHALAATADVRVLVLVCTGAGLDAEAVDAAVLALARVPQPVVAVLDGPTADADAALVLAADLRVVGTEASLHVEPWTGGGVSSTLASLVGRGVAADLLLRPRTLDADEAAALGLATGVADDPHAAAAVLGADLAARAPAEQAAVRRALAHAATHDVASTVEHEAQRRAMLARIRPQA